MYEPLAIATVPKTEDNFTAAHAAKASAHAQAETAERLKADLAPLLAECQKVVDEAAAAGLTAVDVPLSGIRPELRLALTRVLEQKGFQITSATAESYGHGSMTARLTLGWQPVPTPRPPAFRSGQAVGSPGFPLPRRNLLRETPEGGGPPE